MRLDVDVHARHLISLSMRTVNLRCCGLFLFYWAEPKHCGMADHIYKKIELVGSSPNGIEEAVKNALDRARKTVRNMRWFEVAETRGYLEDGKIANWQVTLKVGFTLEG